MGIANSVIWKVREFFSTLNKILQILRKSSKSSHYIANFAKKVAKFAVGAAANLALIA